MAKHAEKLNEKIWDRGLGYGKRVRKLAIAVVKKTRRPLALVARPFRLAVRGLCAVRSLFRGRLVVKTFRILVGVVEYSGIVLLALIAALSVFSLLPLPGNFKSLIVLSGSMEPKIKTGSVILIKPAASYAVGDVVTFPHPSQPKEYITHRIVELKDGQITTKGDANNAADSWAIGTGKIVGKTQFAVPYLGYAVNFAKTPKGFLLLIILPAILIIFNEFLEIKREIEKQYQAKLAEALRKKDSLKTGKALVMLMLLGFTSLVFSSKRSWAGAVIDQLFTDREESTGNSISVAVWDTAETSVVLNEFVPNPTGDDDAARPGGEYVELYNKSATDSFDLAGWHLYDAIDSHELLITSTNSAVSDGAGHELNPNSTVIPPGGFLLVYRDGDGDFELDNDGGDTVRLYNGAIGGVGVVLVDSHAYTIEALVDKSFARIPDGTGVWFDPIPTPGGPNELGEVSSSPVAGGDGGDPAEVEGTVTVSGEGSSEASSPSTLPADSGTGSDEPTDGETEPLTVDLEESSPSAEPAN